MLISYSLVFNILHALYCSYLYFLDVYVILCICTRLYVCTGIMCCIMCLNTCNSVNDMIFVHVLVLIMQVPIYSLRGFCPLPGWLPNWSRPYPLMGFVVVTESALDTGLTSALMGLHTAFRPHTLYE